MSITNFSNDLSSQIINVECCVGIHEIKSDAVQADRDIFKEQEGNTMPIFKPNRHFLNNFLHLWGQGRLASW